MEGERKTLEHSEKNPGHLPLTKSLVTTVTPMVSRSILPTAEQCVQSADQDGYCRQPVDLEVIWLSCASCSKAAISTLTIKIDLLTTSCKIDPEL